jgi:LacI family transcriptional regulator
MPNRVTLADVARIAGVSLMTVSRVVNHKEGVGQETRQRIEAIIEKLGYHPSGIARSLVTQRTGTIGLVVPDISNPFFSDVARGVEQIAFEQGYSVLLCNTEEDPHRELDVLHLLGEKWVDGIVLCSSRLEAGALSTILAQYPAAVLVNRQIDSEIEALPVGSVILDDETGGQIATRHLLDRGHRAVGCLAGPPNSFSGQKRVQGYQAALMAAGLSFNPDLNRTCSPSVAGGFQVGNELLTTHPEITALFCFNDLVAVGVLQACAQLGRRVPDDLAVVGYDDILIASLVTPSLTTCRVPREELGRLATQWLLSRLSGGEAGYEIKVLQPQLVIRASAP